MIKLKTKEPVYYSDVVKPIVSKELYNKFIEFLQNEFFSRNKYDEIINDLYEEEIHDDEEIDIIQNNKNIDKSDDFEI